MKNRLLHQGSDVTYDGLTDQLEKGEILVVAWLPPNHSLPQAKFVKDPAEADEFAKKGKYSLIRELRWYASVARPHEVEAIHCCYPGCIPLKWVE